MKMGDIEIIEINEISVRSIGGSKRSYKEGMSLRSQISILSRNLKEMKEEGTYSNELIENYEKQLNSLIDRYDLEQETNRKINSLLYK